jgi:hypothetical protein
MTLLLYDIASDLVKYLSNNSLPYRKKLSKSATTFRLIGKKISQLWPYFLQQLTVFTMVSAPSEFISEISADGHTAGKTQFEGRCYIVGEGFAAVM